ncbi:MAG TPA: hypothetical protein VGM37_10470 [Armatimonadota bacterium]|jgi:hypothetical protein
MSIAAIKAKIVELLFALPQPGQVVAFPGAELDAAAAGDFSGFFTSITRNGVSQTRRTLGGSGAGKMDRVHAIDIDVYLPMDVSSNQAAAGAEERFDQRVDAILQALADHPRLFGLVSRSEPPRALEDANGIRFYRGVIQCRYRRIRWEVAEEARYDGRN